MCYYSIRSAIIEKERRMSGFMKLEGGKIFLSLFTRIGVKTRLPLKCPIVNFV